MRGPEIAAIDLIRFVRRRVANPQRPCDRDEAPVHLVGHASLRRADRAARSPCGEHVSRRSRVEGHRRGHLGESRPCEKHASRRSRVEGHRPGERNARNVPWSTSATRSVRWRRGPRTDGPRRCARTHFVPAWPRGHRGRRRIESPWLFWVPEGTAGRRSRPEIRPREAVRGAFDEREESMRPRTSLPGAFVVLFDDIVEVVVGFAT